MVCVQSRIRSGKETHNVDMDFKIQTDDFILARWLDNNNKKNKN